MQRAQRVRVLSRVSVFSVVVVAASLGCPASKTPSAAPDASVSAPEPVLTERETQALDGGLAGPGWVLALEAPWLEVKADARARLRPALQGWAVDPGGPLQLTVECGAAAEGAAASSLQAELERTGASQPIKQVSLTPLPPGAWLDGALAQWTSAGVVHVLGRFRLLRGRCDVHALGPERAAPVQRLRAAVSGFGSSRPRLLAEFSSLSAWLLSDPLVSARINAARDAGVGDHAGEILMVNALVRLPPERLAERFEMRLKLLGLLTTRECGAIVRLQAELSPAVLEQLPEPVAVRWVQLTREAMALAARAKTPPVIPSAEAVADAIEAMVAGDDEAAAAVATLRAPDAAPDEVICVAELVRLRKVLAQPPARRELLMRSLVSPPP